MIQTVVRLFPRNGVVMLSDQLPYRLSRALCPTLPGLAAWLRCLSVAAGPHSLGYQRLFRDRASNATHRPMTKATWASPLRMRLLNDSTCRLWGLACGQSARIPRNVLQSLSFCH